MKEENKANNNLTDEQIKIEDDKINNNPTDEQIKSEDDKINENLTNEQIKSEDNKINENFTDEQIKSEDNKINENFTDEQINNAENSSKLINQTAPTEPEDQKMIRQMVSLISKSNIELSNLKQIIESRLKYDKVKEDAFEKLYIELDELKKNSFFERSRPLFNDLILLFDRLENYRRTEKGELSQVTQILNSFSEEILEILRRQGIEILDSSSSTAFDPSTQRAINTEITSDKGEDNKVSKIIRRGFRYFDNIFRPEEVTVKKYSIE